MNKIYLIIVRYVLNFFDYFQQKKIINFLKAHYGSKSLVFFDVGSHYGETTKLFFKYFKIKEFHCFEASPENFVILKKTINDQPFKDICKINNFGVGSKNYEFFLNQTKESSSSTINSLNFDSVYMKKKLKILNIKNKSEYFKKIPIQIISLDHYLKGNNLKIIDILKIDTEGFEFEVLKGLELNLFKVKVVYFEHHYDNMISKNYKFRDINNLLVKNKFKKVLKTKMIFRKSFEYIYINKSI